MSELIPPSLYRLGLPQKGDPDLETIWLTPYPVMRRYETLCNRVECGPVSSGYRAKIVEGNMISPHHFGFAIDVLTPEGMRFSHQLKMADEAVKLYSRIGFYPGRGFLHLDQAPDNWMNKYTKSRYWVQVAGVYHIFDDYLSARNCAESEL